MKHLYFLLMALMVAFATGCSSDDDDDGNSGAGQHASKTIVAAAGGELTIGSATLSIPANALSSDTTVTVATANPASSLPEQATLKGLTYDFGPNGTTFLKPVSLTLPVSGTPGSGDSVVISWYDETSKQWQDAATTVTGGSAKAEITHFTLFVVRFKGTSSLDCSYTACGGDLTGTWTVAGACVDDPGVTNPFEGCTGATFDLGADASGTVEFASSGSYSVNITFSGMLSLTLPWSCLPMGLTSCADLGNGMSDSDTHVTCTGDASSGCTCTGSVAGDTTNENGTYTTSGSQLTTDSGDGSPETHSYCVNGSELRVQNQSSDGAKVTFVAHK